MNIQIVLIVEVLLLDTRCLLFMCMCTEDFKILHHSCIIYKLDQDPFKLFFDATNQAHRPAS